MKRTMCIMMTLVLLCGLIPAIGAAETGLMDIRDDSVGFCTKVPEGHTFSVNGNDNITIWLSDPGYVPNIWICRRDDKIDPSELIYEDYPDYMKDKYGDRLRAVSTHEYLEYGGKKLPAVSFIYKDANGYSVHQINLMEVRDDGDMEYQVRFGDEDKDMALEALDAVIRYYQPDAQTGTGTATGNGSEPTGTGTATGAGSEPTGTGTATGTGSGSGTGNGPTTGTGSGTAPVNVSTVRYEDNRFFINLPAGWRILTSGDHMTFCFKAWDPSEPDRCIFMFMKLEPILKSQTARDAYWQLHQIASQVGDNSYLFFAKAPVMEKCDLASFLKTVPEGEEYCRYFQSTGLVLNPDVYPQMRNAKIIRDVDGFAAITATDNAGKRIDGLVTAYPVEGVSYYVNGVDMSSYTVYGFMGVTTPEGEMNAWNRALIACLCSFGFQPKYVQDSIDISNSEKDAMLAWGEQMSQMMEAMVKAWVGY